MNSSTLSLLLFTLSLILISHAPLPTLGLCLYESICEEAAEDKVRCLEVLKADPKVVGANDYKKLSKSVLKLGLKKSVEAQNYLKEVMKTNPSPAIKQCATFDYDGVVGSFKSSLGEIKVDGMTANYDAKVAGDGPTTCDRALANENIVNPSITSLNKDIFLLSKISFLVTDHLS